MTVNGESMNRVMSLPPREAWIEIYPDCLLHGDAQRSLPPREAWIEIAV